jgi:hypothetical protein
MECIINGTKIKYEDDKIWVFGRQRSSKEETWYVLKGNIQTLKSGYKRHRTGINGKQYTTARILYKLSHLEWDIEDSGPNNTIDHISINSLDNRIENLRTATMAQQTLNRKCMIDVKGYYWCKASQKWKAQISIDGEYKYLGYFDLEADARQAYLDAVAKHRV